MKVIFTLDALINAGTEKSMLEIIPHFSADTKAEVLYMYPRHDLKAAYEAAGIKLHYLGLPGRFSFFRGVKQLKKIIHKEKPDIIVSSLLRANLISRVACRLTGTKLVGTFVSDSYSKQRTTSFHLTRKIGFAYYYWLDRLTASIPCAWISNSQSIKESNCRVLKVREDKVTVIYRGRDVSKFKTWAKPDTNDEFVFATMGRLLETKGFMDLILAFSKAEKLFPQIRLNIYGEGPDRNKLTHLINQLQLTTKITLHGNVPDAWQKLYESHCFVFPSWYEGFSGALVEAMMTGIPIIASDIPMNMEAITAGRTALVHKVKDVESLADAMKKMVAEYPAMIDMGARARAEAAARFDIRIIAKQYEAFLHAQVNK
jgi:glycosyltransferase involved in cell wall biosynthesis